MFLSLLLLVSSIYVDIKEGCRCIEDTCECVSTPNSWKDVN